MPLKRGKDSKGSYYRWGNRTKYYYVDGNKRSKSLAKEKAMKQMRAIYSSGYKKG